MSENSLSKNQLIGGRYRISKKIGEGGMATVYLATDETLERQVAIKVLHPHYSQHPEIRERFFQEAKAISAMDHPNILRIFDFSGDKTDQLWMVTEYLEGATLREFTRSSKQNRLHAIGAAIITREIVRGLEQAHRDGIVHRDIKPENIFLLKDGRLKLMDFGIAKNLKRKQQTATGLFMGSPSYMSPEQIEGNRIDTRSDIYSLGVVFYEIITGKLPFFGKATHDIAAKICKGVFISPKKIRPSLPDDLEKMILRSMAKHPLHRYQKVENLAKDLDRFLTLSGVEDSTVGLANLIQQPDAFYLAISDHKKEPHVTSKALDRTEELSTPSAAAAEITIPVDHKISQEGSKDKVHVHLNVNLPASLTERRSKTQTVEIPPATRPKIMQLRPKDSPVPPQHPTLQKSRGGQKTQWHPPQDAQNKPRLQRAHKRFYGRAQIEQLKKIRQQKIRQEKRESQTTLGVAILLVLAGLILVNIYLFLKESASQTQQTPAISSTLQRIESLPPETRKQMQEVAQGIREKMPERTQIAPGAKDKAHKTSPQTQKRTDTRPQVLLPTNTPLASKPMSSPEIRQQSTRTLASPSPSLAPRRNEEVPKPTPPLAPEPQKIQTPLAEPARKSAPPLPRRRAADTKPATPVRQISPSLIRVRSQPAGTIYINGSEVGTTLDETFSSSWIRCEGSSVPLEIRREGFITYRRSLDCSKGDKIDLESIELKKNKKDSRETKGGSP